MVTTYRTIVVICALLFPPLAAKAGPAAGAPEAQKTATSTDYERGASSYNQGDYDKAIEYFSKVLAINPKHVQAYFGRASSYGNKGDHDKAINDYSKVTGIDPNEAKLKIPLSTSTLLSWFSCVLSSALIVSPTACRVIYLISGIK